MPLNLYDNKIFASKEMRVEKIVQHVGESSHEHESDDDFKTLLSLDFFSLART